MVTRENVIDRLKQLGYTAVEDDYDAIDFELNEVINYTLNYCNSTEIPEIVEPRLINRVCSYFLYYKKNSGDVGTLSKLLGHTQITTTMIYAHIMKDSRIAGVSAFDGML